MRQKVLTCSLLESRTLLQCTQEGFFDSDTSTANTCALNDSGSEITSIPNSLLNRFVTPVAAFGLGLLRALPETVLTLVPTALAAGVPFCFSKPRCASQDIENSLSPLFMGLPALITAFAIYPLAHETIETLAQIGPCEDPDFCGGAFEAMIEGYTHRLDNAAIALNDAVQPAYGTVLAITDPLKIYDNTRSAASVLFNAFAGSLIGKTVGQKNIKFSTPHMEFLDTEPTEKKATA